MLFHSVTFSFSFNTFVIIPYRPNAFKQSGGSYAQALEYSDDARIGVPAMRFLAIIRRVIPFHCMYIPIFSESTGMWFCRLIACDGMYGDVEFEKIPFICISYSTIAEYRQFRIFNDFELCYHWRL